MVQGHGPGTTDNTAEPHPGVFAWINDGATQAAGEYRAFDFAL